MFCFLLKHTLKKISLASKLSESIVPKQAGLGAFFYMTKTQKNENKVI